MNLNRKSDSFILYANVSNVCPFPFFHRESEDDAFVSQFSDLLLQKLFEAAIQAAGDHDKVKSNAVRGLGMLVRFMQPPTLGKSYLEISMRCLRKV